MKTHRHLLIIFVITLFGSAPTFIFADSAPSWLQQAALAKPPAYEKDVKAVVLYKDQHVMLDSNGRLLTVENYAVKVLTREGRREAAGVAFYLSNFSQVTNMLAWLIAPGGTVKGMERRR